MSDLANQQTETPGQDAPKDGNDGFSAAFADRANGDGKQADEEPSQEPAEARSDEAPAEAAAAAPDSGEAPAFDPYAGLTPEQKSHFARLEASERSNRGRVSALQRKLSGSSAATQAPTPAPREAAAEAGQGDDKAASSDEPTVSDLDKRLQDAVSEYGEVIGPVAELLAEVRAEIASMKGTVSAVEEELGAQELAEAQADLTAAHPDWTTIAQDESYAAWLSDQPKPVVELANSFDPTEVSLALTLFKTERSAAMASQTGQSGDTQGQQASTATDARRQKQLEGSKVISNRGAPAAAGTPNDFTSAFKARAAATARQR